MAAAVQPRRSRHRWHAPEKGSGPAFALSLLAHTLLFIAIAFVVQWKSEPVGTISAELWSLPPPSAVQPPPPPPPPVKVEPQVEPPRKADIIEEKKPPPKKDEPKKPDPPKKVDPPKKDEAKLAAQEAAQLKAAQEARMKQLLAQAGPAPTAGAAAGGGRSDKYAAQVVSCIRPHIIFNVPDSITARQYEAVFEVTLLPTGEQTGAPRLIKASGLAAYDQAVERAIRRCDPFPPPREGTMPRSIRPLFDPVDTR